MNEHITPIPNTRGKQIAPRLRCAIYTRKSTEDGLDQDFNSLDAQREACTAYITSQASLGWKLSSKLYDDGGISGGTMERPALKQLLTDIKQGLIDIIVVYKIDRLTRSLMDFSKMVDVFDQHNISFVSITQQFNTTTSMGRLTLNVLLSFAQFEREVTAERIKDKIAASKKKGMWMGGIIPLGYKAENKMLIANNEESKTVKWLFEQYLELGSVIKLVEATERVGMRGRKYLQKNGEVRSSKPFARGNLYHLLSNPVYIGKTRHQDQVYEGLHDAIISDETWQAVQELMAGNTKARRSTTNERSPHLLKGLIIDETGDRLTTTHAIKKKIRYQYYISSRLTNTSKTKHDGWRISAKQLERPVVRTIMKILSDPLKLGEIIKVDDYTIHQQELVFEKAKDIAEELGGIDNSQVQSLLKCILQRITLKPTSIKIEINVLKLAKLLGSNKEIETSKNTLNKTSSARKKKENGNEGSNIYLIEIEHRIAKRGVEAKLVIQNSESRTRNPDQTLIDIIANANLWLSKLTNGSASSIGDLANELDHNPSEISRFLPLAFLAPDIVMSILAGTQPVDLTQEKLRRLPTLPYNWTDQSELLGFVS